MLEFTVLRNDSLVLRNASMLEIDQWKVISLKKIIPY